MKIKSKIGFKGAVIGAVSMITFFVSQGCQKVINVDLNEAAPRIVIEGVINDRRGPYNVIISKSGSYFNQPTLDKVSDATVIVTDDAGTADTLRETIPGVYLTRVIRGTVGRTYTLKVFSGDQEYDGVTTMSEHVSIDSLRLLKSQLQRIDFGGTPKNETRFEIHCFFTDPPEKNYYRIRVFKNDSINTENYRLYDDQYTNGRSTELRVAFASEAGTYRVELLSLDKETYGYYRTLADLLFTNPFFGSTPANPNTNLTNGALGYFGAYAVSSKTIVITDSLINSLK